MSLYNTIKEILPKLIIFSIMLLVVTFQKDFEKLKSLGYSDKTIKDMQESGNYLTSAFEYGPYARDAINNIIFSLFLILILIFLQYKNHKLDLKQEELQQKVKQEQSKLNEGQKEKQDSKYLQKTKKTKKN